MNNTFDISLSVPIRRCPALKKGACLKILWFASFASVVSLLIFYIFQVNLMTKETYLIQGYQKKLNQLSQENQSLEIDFSQANSLSNVADLIKNLNFEKAGQIRYIQVLEGQVVAK